MRSVSGWAVGKRYTRFFRCYRTYRHGATNLQAASTTR
jgi:hypothetical protein